MEENNFQEIAIKAKNASKKVATLSTEIKNKALLNILTSKSNTPKAVNKDDIIAIAKAIKSINQYFIYLNSQNNTILY